jgi:DNA polymerase IV
MASTHLSATATALDKHVTEASTSPKPNLTSLPSTFILASHLSESELHEVEDLLVERGAPLTYDIKEANLVIGNISKEKRAKFELKRGKVDCENILGSATPDSSNQISVKAKVPKRRKLNNGMLVPIKDLVASEKVDIITDADASDGTPTMYLTRSFR